jgi:hypothetical protein
MYRACHVRARLCNPEKGGQRGGTRRASAKGGAPVNPLRLTRHAEVVERSVGGALWTGSCSSGSDKHKEPSR